MTSIPANKYNLDSGYTCDSAEVVETPIPKLAVCVPNLNNSKAANDNSTPQNLSTLDKLSIGLKSNFSRDALIGAALIASLVGIGYGISEYTNQPTPQKLEGELVVVNDNNTTRAISYRLGQVPELTFTYEGEEKSLPLSSLEKFIKNDLRTDTSSCTLYKNFNVIGGLNSNQKSIVDNGIERYC